jgi:serine/threonine-protein kinase
VKVAQLLLPVIRALGNAHAHGIVHRDLKPENIFLARIGGGRVQPKLLDFGIAKLESARSLRLTTAGEVMGSPLYMAPEQARGEEVDARADVWAICVVLYEAIAGQTPFTGDDRGEVFRAVNEGEPDSLVRLGLADETLWQIVQRGLKKNRDERFDTMAELGQALARWLLDRDVHDDIAGASLDAAWFRSSPQSFFSSTLPPARRSLRAGQKRVLELWRQVAASAPGRWLESLQPRGRWAILAGALVVATGSVSLIAASLIAEPETRSPTRRAEQQRSPATSPGEPAALETPDEVPTQAADTQPADDETDPDQRIDEARGAEPAPRAAPPRAERERRRSRLINPY